MMTGSGALPWPTPPLPTPTSSPQHYSDSEKQQLGGGSAGSLDLHAGAVRGVGKQRSGGARCGEEGKGVAPGVRDANKRTALHFVAREGQAEDCKFLIKLLFLPIDPKDNDGGSTYFVVL